MYAVKLHKGLSFSFQIFQPDPGDLHDRLLRRQRGDEILEPVCQPRLA